MCKGKLLNYPVIPLLETKPKELKWKCRRDIYALVFLIMVSITKMWNQTKHSISG